MRNRIALVVAAMFVGGFLGHVLHILNAEPHAHVPPLGDDVMADIDDATAFWRDEAMHMAALAGAMEMHR